MDEYFVKIKELKKTFDMKRGKLEVLKGVNLNIHRGDIFGIMGASGAGKSTLIRCINRLEEPSSGTVIIDGSEITSLSKRELKEARKKIGMIFQTFNLFDSKTVFQNVEYPLNLTKMSQTQKKERIMELLEMVGLSEKINQFPSQLSGGQRQRVGIARALANNPKILLCDEATSSLDPQTTLSILDLLKKINKAYGLTIIMISHEIEVLRYACEHVAILEKGIIAEVGNVREVMSQPQSITGKMFLNVEEQLAEEWKKKENDNDF